jgi:hypothetical protein
MKRLVFLLISGFICSSSFSQGNGKKIYTPDPNKKIQVVEAACGQCQFKLEGEGCNLAVKINGKAYFVDGTSIDEHGDAHAKDGFCNAVRKAEVQGELVDNRFQASYFKLVKETEKKDGGKPKN